MIRHVTRHVTHHVTPALSLQGSGGREPHGRRGQHGGAERYQLSGPLLRVEAQGLGWRLRVEAQGGG